MRRFSVLFLVVLLICSCAKNKFKGSQFLQDFYTYKIEPDLAGTADALTHLQTRFKEFNQNPDASNFEVLQDQFRLTLRAFEQIAFYNLGDISAVSVYNAVYKVNIDSSAIWSDYADAANFTTDQVIAYGNKEKGVYALEYLLFFPGAEDSSGSPKYRSFLGAQVGALVENFEQVKTAWSTYEKNFVSKSDEGVEGSYNMVVNRIVHALEDLIDKRINPVLDAGNSEWGAGYWSSTSWSNIKTQVEQLKAIYLGNGTKSFNSIYNSVHRRNRKLADQIRDTFLALEETGAQMNAAMDYYATTGSSELVQYKEKLKELLVQFKIDVVHELDIVLTFGDNDGD